MLDQNTKESKFHIFKKLKKKLINRKVDHIVCVVSDLEKAINEFEQKLGVRPIFGNCQISFGTQNALINMKRYNPKFGRISNDSRNFADGSSLQWKLGIPLMSP